MEDYKEDFDPYLRARNLKKLGRTKEERELAIKKSKEIIDRREREYETNGITSEQAER